MRQGLHSEIRLIVFISLLLFIFGLINGHIMLTLLLGGTAYVVWTLQRILKLYHWLTSDSKQYPPESFGIWADISDHLYRLQQRNEQAKLIHRSLLRRVNSITSALDDGMVILNRDRSIDWWNPAASRLLKLNEDDRGRTITTLVRDPRFVRFMQKGEFAQPLEIPSQYRQGQTLMFSAATFEAGGIVLVIRDITRLRNLEQMRKDFVANISHELRTPLTVLTGYLETLQMDAEALPKPLQRPLEQMSRQVDRMTALADDLVMLSQLESVDFQPSHGPVEIKPMLEKIASDARTLSGGEHSLTVTCPDDLKIFGANNELYSAFSNLVFNAVRHNPKGGDIRLIAEQHSGEVIIRIEDNGVGIDPKHLPRLTERFYRVDDSRTSSSGGTGLGLAIVKHVLLRHDAELNIASELGKGTSMSCQFKQPAEALSKETPRKHA